MKSILGFILFFALSISLKAQKKLSKESPIGVFDSGTGGLTVLNAILTMDAFDNETGEPKPDGKRDFEHEDFQYLADQANMPYGNYSSENKTDLLKEHILKNADFLFGNNYTIYSNNNWINKQKSKVKMMVVACNTATAYALPEIKAVLNSEHLAAPCVGVIDAGAKAAIVYQKNNGEGLIGVFATVGTVASNGYARTITEMAKNTLAKSPEVVSHGGLGLAESIDRDWGYYIDTLKNTRSDYKGPSLKNKSFRIDTSLLPVYKFNNTANKLLCEFDENGSCLDVQLNDPSNYVRYHLVSLLEKILVLNPAKPMNTLILGCTHYPFMKDSIDHVLKELYNYKSGDNYRYRKILASHVELIDPAIETAKEAFIILRDMGLRSKIRSNDVQFFISVPNNELKEIQLQPDGWFTYGYKYGREVGQNKMYVKIVPFDHRNISDATYARFHQALPAVSAAIGKFFSYKSRSDK